MGRGADMFEQARRRQLAEHRYGAEEQGCTDYQVQEGGWY